MTKYIYPSNEIAHLFAADPNAYAANSARNVRCENGRLYSYAQPIAAWHGDKILVSSDSFSVTTTRHQSWLHYAINHLPKIYLPNLRDALIVSKGHTNFAAEYIAARIDEIDALKEKAPRLRSDHTKRHSAAEIARLESACEFVWRELCGKKSHWTRAIQEKAKTDKAATIQLYTRSRNSLESGMENARRMIETARERMATDWYPHGLHKWWILDNARADIMRLDQMGAARGSATFDHAKKLMGKQWAQECQTLAQELCAYAESFTAELQELRAESDRQESVKHAASIADWIAGGDSSYPFGLPVACRVKGDTVETSKGARVPLDQALQFVTIAKKCRETGKGIDLKGRAIGPYRGNSIDSHGNMTIGCHHITWDAIADCVARYEAKGN